MHVRMRGLRPVDRAQRGFVDAIGRRLNHASRLSGPAVTIPRLRDGDVGVALSVLYLPFDELDMTSWYRRRPPYSALPKPRYLRTLLRQLDAVERDVAERHPRTAAVVHSVPELERALADGRVALVHCVEGGFHLGGTAEEIDEGVTLLARRGVAYVTVSHLFWRRLATCTNAFPFMRDRLFARLWPQPRVGLSELGVAAVRAMVREGVLVDLSHMSARATADTFALLDRLDPARSVPVVASHAAYRFGTVGYNLDAATVRRIAERGGVIGLILSERYICDGLRREPTTSFEESAELLLRHVDRLAEITGSLDHVGIGSDLDGFIKPTLAGFDAAGGIGRFEGILRTRYGAAGAAAIASGNALRVLRAGWQRPTPVPALA